MSALDSLSLSCKGVTDDFSFIVNCNSSTPLRTVLCAVDDFPPRSCKFLYIHTSTHEKISATFVVGTHYFFRYPAVQKTYQPYIAYPLSICVCHGNERSWRNGHRGVRFVLEATLKAQFFFFAVHVCSPSFAVAMYRLV